MSNKVNDNAVFALSCIGLIFLFFTSILLKGYVLSRLWEWFIVPFGVAPIAVAHAYGLTLVASLIRPNVGGKDSSAAETFINYGVLMPLVLWFAGWCVNSFMN